MSQDSQTPTGPARAQVAWLVDTDAPQAASVRVWGLSARERLARGLRRAGVARIADASSEPAPGEPDSGSGLVVRADHFYDERLLQALVAAPEGILLCADDGRPLAARVPVQALAAAAQRIRQAGPVADGEPPPGPGGLALRRVGPDALVPAFDPRLRKHAPAFALPARADAVRALEDRLFAAAYKDVTDFVTKWVWPRPARAVTRACVRLGLSPNAITFVSYVLAIAVTLLFARGDTLGFGLGLVLAWCMTFLDTVDGKLARVTLTSSRLGHVLDHGLDLVHPPIWWTAFAWGLAADEPGLGSFTLAWAVVVVGYVLGRLLEGVFILAFGQEMFTWRRFDGWFRQVIARRNPNLVLLSLGTLAGRPDLGFHAVAVWTLVGIGVQLVRIAQALALWLRGRPIRSWYEEAADASEPASR